MQLITLDNVLAATKNEFLRRRFGEICLIFAKFQDRQEETLPVDLFYERKDAFRTYLRERMTRSQSEFKKYSDHIPAFFDVARTLGWSPDQQLSREWKKVLEEEERRVQHAAISPRKPRASCIELIRYFGRLYSSPKDVTKERVDDWERNAVISGDRTYLSAFDAARSFERLLLDEGFTNVNPVLAVRREVYRMDLEDFPPVLQKEVKDFLDFREKAPGDFGDLKADMDPEEISAEEIGEFENDSEEVAENGEVVDVSEEPRRVTRRRQANKCTVGNLRKYICLLYGYARKKSQDKELENIGSLQALFSRHAFKSYMKFLKKGRLVQPRSIKNIFSTLIGSARQYQKLGDLDWFERFLLEIETETEADELKRRRERACQINYKSLEAIPRGIDKEIRAIRAIRTTEGDAKYGFYAKKSTKHRIARLEMEKFLIQWMLVLPWPAKLIRQCRVDGDRPNLFKRPIRPEDHLTLPPWMQKGNGLNSKTEFWQFSFRGEESPNGFPVHAVLPQCLIDPLEDYLDKTRKVLLDTTECEALFLTNDLTEYKERSIIHLFNGITLRFAGVAVSSQVFRDVWAFEYLIHRPRDYFGLALNLLHFNDDVTRRLYGGDDDQDYLVRGWSR